jgi:hypothetical protein
MEAELVPVLGANGWDVTKTAKVLAMSRGQLLRLMGKLGDAAGAVRVERTTFPEPSTGRRYSARDAAEGCT